MSKIENYSRLHSKTSTDAAWRAAQAHVDADIEGLARDANIDKFVSDMREKGVGPKQRIKLIVEYYKVKNGTGNDSL